MSRRFFLGRLAPRMAPAAGVFVLVEWELCKRCAHPILTIRWHSVGALAIFEGWANATDFAMRPSGIARMAPACGLGERPVPLRREWPKRNFLSL